MYNLRWANTTTISKPPGRRKRVSKRNWNAMRSRIEELYEEYEVPQLVDILAQEGFIVSERQIRHHLAVWGNKKYMKLSEKQWRYILKTLQERTKLGKKTAFKLRSEQITRLPSNKIERALARKLADGFIGSSSRYNSGHSTSSGGIIAYTPSGSQRRGGSTGVRLPDLRNSEARNPSYSLQFGLVSEDVSQHFHRQNCLDEFARQFSVLQEAYPNSSLIVSDELTIFCVDCRIRSALRVSDPQEIRGFFEKYERKHILSQNHTGRVHLRMLGNPKPSFGFPSGGYKCGHFYPDDRVTETNWCWEAGGCRWAQIKTVEEDIIRCSLNNPQFHAAVGEEIDFDMPNLAGLLMLPSEDEGVSTLWSRVGVSRWSQVEAPGENNIRASLADPGPYVAVKMDLDMSGLTEPLMSAVSRPNRSVRRPAPPGRPSHTEVQGSLQQKFLQTRFIDW